MAIVLARGGADWRRVLPALAGALIVGALVVVVLPRLTGSSLSELKYWVDWWHWPASPPRVPPYARAARPWSAPGRADAQTDEGKTTMNTAPDHYRDLTQAVSLEAVPAARQHAGGDEGLQRWVRAATAPGALDAKTKEPIALALSVAVADPCIGFHTRTLAAGRHAPGSGRDAGRGHLHGRRALADVRGERGGGLRRVFREGGVGPGAIRRCAAAVPAAHAAGSARHRRRPAGPPAG